MNAFKLGPRRIPYIDSDGVEGVGSIIINFGQPINLDVGEGESIERQTGILNVEIFGRNYIFLANGSDDIQVAFYLMRIAGIWLVRVAEEEGLTLFHYNSFDIDDPMDVFES
ncbi:hypothetical protein [Caulobacter sp.]|uniref:hypothetical protein n=1 Tax=Caulobacter sp. TaxID=78 RepID=UPI003BA9A02A